MKWPTIFVEVFLIYNSTILENESKLQPYPPATIGNVYFLAAAASLSFILMYHLGTSLFIYSGSDCSSTLVKLNKSVMPFPLMVNF